MMNLWIAAMAVVYGGNGEVPGTKRTLKGNMTEVYHQLPLQVDSLNEMLTQGKLYGRLRLNSFIFGWEEESAKRKDHFIAGLGGSFIYKTAYLNGFGATAGFYFTEARGSLDRDESNLYKSGKDTLSRYDRLSSGKQGITSLAQAYLEYKNTNFDVKLGRQIFESFLTKSNDTKMIPNTFEGLSFSSKYIPKTTLKAAYLTRQKLRDHSTFHHLFAYGDDPSDPYAKYSQNDDASMHIGLTESKLAAKGIDDRLVILDATNKSMDNLMLRMNYTAVPELISSAMIQADYAMHIGSLSVIPALRYMKQFDDGAGEIGGANLKTITDGYSDPKSLDSWLAGARIDLKQDVWKLRFGYTQIADKGDIVAPWRGFPTGGFTRVMGQYNWYANTRTIMIRADYDFDKAGLVPKLKGFMRFGIQDFDDNKPGVQADSDVITLDLLKAFESMPNLSMKLRYAHVFGDPLVNGTIIKSDPSYDEARFEINYLF